MIYDLFYNPLGFALPFFLIAALIGGWRAKRRNESILGIIGSAFAVGFVTFALSALVIVVGVLILLAISF